MDLTDRRLEHIQDLIAYFSLALNFTHPVLVAVNFHLRYHLKQTLLKENAIDNLRKVWFAFAEAGEFEKVYSPGYSSKNFKNMMLIDPNALLKEVKNMMAFLPQTMNRANPLAVVKIVSSENYMDFVDFFILLGGCAAKS
jgi:hypothetical protein